MLRHVAPRLPRALALVALVTLPLDQDRPRSELADADNFFHLVEHLAILDYDAHRAAVRLLGGFHRGFGAAARISDEVRLVHPLIILFGEAVVRDLVPWRRQ